MLRLPQMVGTVTFVALSGGYLPAAEASPPATITRPPLLVCPDPSEAGQPATPGARPNQELMASETFQRAMTDVLRLEIAVRFCELRPDTLTLDLGDGASTSASTDYNLSRLYAAYRAITEFSPETALELRNQDRLAGWYTTGGLAWTEKPAAPPGEPVGEGDAETVRTGFHFNAGVGAGAFEEQCRDCEIDSETGFSGFLSMGGFLDPLTVLGVEGTGWIKDVSGVSVLVYSAMGQVTRYLSATSGLFLRGGVGLVGYHDDADLSATGPGFSGRLGYEFLEGKVRIVPYVGYIRTFDGIDMKRNGDPVGFNFVISQFQLGLGVSVY
ncbi:MAG: hypothetical protein ACAI18_05360 [Gemmatimonadales bacterium]